MCVNMRVAFYDEADIHIRYLSIFSWLQWLLCVGEYSSGSPVVRSSLFSLLYSYDFLISSIGSLEAPTCGLDARHVSEGCPG